MPHIRSRLNFGPTLPKGGRLGALALVLAACIAASAYGQNVAPVYVDDSVAARETLAKIPELLGAGNVSEAARTLQTLLDTESERMLEVAGDGDFFRPTRLVIHELLLSNPELMARYRVNETEKAQALLDSGDYLSVEHTRLLTPAGAQAALRLAQVHLEAGRFDAARICLTQLTTHPDAGAGTAFSKDVARMALRIARYLGRADARAWATERCAAAGLAPPTEADLAAVPRPARAAITPLSPGSAAGPLPTALDGPDALASASLGSQFDRSRDLADEQLRAVDQEAEIPERAIPWTFATVAGETVFVNDGVEITAMDRYTLSQRWRSRPPEMVLDESSYDERRGRIYRSELGGSLEDISGVSVGSGMVVAATGLAVGGGRRGDPRVHAFDELTGNWVWSVDPVALDPSLESATVRGEIVIDADTAIVPLRKRASSRRISSAYLLGLDLNSGATKWLRLLATAGALPSPTRDRLADSPLLDRGYVYQTDTVGVIACVEAESGRPVWTRRFRSETSLRNGMPSEISPVFNVSRPVLEDGQLIVIQPGGDSLLGLEASSGKILAQRALATIGDPRVIFRVGDSLVAPTLERFVIVPLKNFQNAQATMSNIFGATTVRGRASSSDGKLVVPTIDGLTVIDPHDPQNTKVIPLHSAGNVVIADQQLIVTDARRIHSFVAFESAEKLLRERLARTPADAEPALDLARLACRAGRWELVPQAADAALKVFDTDPTTTLSKAGRRRLFELLLDATQTGLTPKGNQKSRAALQASVALQIVDRMAQCVDSSAQRVEQLLMLAKVRDFAGSAPEAIEAYQRILTDESLAATVRFAGTLDESSGGAEATARLKQIVQRTGIASYRMFEEEAQRAVAAAGNDGVAIERAARAYPVAEVAPRAWSAAAAAYSAAGQERAATRCLSLGLDAAIYGVSVGRAELTSSAPAIAASLSESLLAGNRPGAASRVLSGVNAVPVELASRFERIRADVRTLLDQPRRLPDVGLPGETRPALLVGWTAPADFPLLPDRRGRSSENIVLFCDSESKLALFCIRPDGTFAPAWEKHYEGQRPSLVRMDSTRVLLYEPAASGGAIESIDILTGASQWKSQDFAQWFEGIPERRRADAAAPAEGISHAVDLLVAADDSTLVLAQRSGRLGAISLADGKRLWASNTALDGIFDCTVDGGVVTVSGGTETAVRAPGTSLAPAILVLDSKNGTSLRTSKASDGWFASRLKGAVHWIHGLSGGRTAFGFDDGVLLVDVAHGRVEWSLDDDALTQTSEAWVLPGDILVIADRDRHLHLVRTDKGQAHHTALISYNKITDNSRIRVERSGDQIAVCTERGLLLYDLDGKLTGVDGLGDDTPILPPALTRSGILALGTGREELLEAGRDSYELREAAALYALDRRTGMLSASRWIIMYEDPTAMHLLDGKIVICTGTLSLVIDAPADNAAVVSPK